MEQKAKAIFAAANAQGKQKSMEIAEVYQKSGMEVLEIAEQDILRCQEIARQQQATHLLYFHDQEQITMHIFSEEMGEISVEMQVSDLQMP